MDMILVIFYMILLEVLYHKCFSVLYFNLGYGLYKELLISFFLAVILTGLTIIFFPAILVIGAIIIGLYIYGKNK